MSQKAFKQFRETQRQAAIARDAGFCVFCFFVKGVKKQASDVHHVFGRSTIESENEHYTSLVCTCRLCHPPPIKTRGSNIIWQTSILSAANATPINNGFIHENNEKFNISESDLQILNALRSAWAAAKSKKQTKDYSYRAAFQHYEIERGGKVPEKL